jgi:hypothetical protein
MKNLYSCAIVKENYNGLERETETENLLGNISPELSKYALIEMTQQANNTEKITKIMFSNDSKLLGDIAQTYRSFYNYVEGYCKSIQGQTSKIGA